MYKPKPIDTSHVQLSDNLLELTEHLAKNAHNIWAQQRIAEGWKGMMQPRKTLTLCLMAISLHLRRNTTELWPWRH